MTAINAYCNGWNKEGVPYFDCSKCTEDLKEAFGCGYDPKYSGKCRMKQGKHNLHGKCPGYWRTQPYIIDLIYMAKNRANLGHPNDIPNRLVQSMMILDAYEVEASATRNKEQG